MKTSDEYAGEAQEVLTSQEDGLEWGTLAKHKVRAEAANHYKSNLCTIGIQCKSSCDLNLGYNAL